MSLDLTVLNDLQARLENLTAAQFAAAERRLAPFNKKKPEKIIGQVESETTRGLFVLMSVLKSEYVLELALAANESDEIGERLHKEKAALLDMFGDVAEELFWAQARIDLGFYEEGNVGIRVGWQLVRNPAREGPPDFIARLMSGSPLHEPEE